MPGLYPFAKGSRFDSSSDITYATVAFPKLVFPGVFSGATSLKLTPRSICLPFSTLRLPLLARRTALTIEFCADVACLITSVKSAFGFFSASSIAVTAALTLATAASVFGRPIDLARYSPIVAEILDRRLRSS